MRSMKWEDPSLISAHAQYELSGRVPAVGFLPSLVQVEVQVGVL